MQAYLVGALLFAVLVSVFAIQNIRPVEIHFLIWELREISLVLVILGSAFIGAVVVFFLGAFRQFSNQRVIKELTKKNKALEMEIENYRPDNITLNEDIAGLDQGLTETSEDKNL